MDRVLELAASLMLVLSCAAFGFWTTQDPADCFAVYQPSSIWAPPPNLCDTGTCGGTCAMDSLHVGTVEVDGKIVDKFKLWCECDGANAGVLEGPKCHAVVEYLNSGLAWLYDDHSCQGPCPTQTDDCTDMIPNPGDGDAGNKLCDCR